MTHRIEKLEEILAYQDHENTWVKLYFDRVKVDGRPGRYNRIVERNGRPGVAILPVRKGLVGLIHIYRYPIHETVWEIPRGYAETDTPLADATSELYEETGIRAQPADFTALGILFPNSGILTSRVHLFLARCDEAAQSTPPTNEANEFRWFALKDILRRVAIGEINDMFTISALMRSSVRGYLPDPSSIDDQTEQRGTG